MSHIEITEELRSQIALFDAMCDEEEDNVVAHVLPIVVEETDELAAQATTMQALINEHRDETLHTVYDPKLAAVLKEIESIAHSNITALYECRQIWEQVGHDEGGNPRFQLIERMHVRDFTELPDKVTACIQSFKVKHGRDGDVVEFKLYDKLKALDMLMRHHGGYAKENEQMATAGNAFMDILFGTVEAQGLPVPKGVN